jgi:uncharacterized membrane protein YeiH
LLGTFVFALSGVTTARENHFDFFGATVIAFVTALGGGTLRDVLIGSQPVGWMSDTNYIFCVIGAIIFGVFFQSAINQLRKTMFLFDSIGIGLFTIAGLNKTLLLGVSPFVALMMGVVSAVFGGVIRDLLTNQIPLIFRQEFYASACFVGGILYLTMKYWLINEDVCMLTTVIFIATLRILAVRYKWGLPLPQ